MVAQLGQTAMALGLPFGSRTRTYNSRLAQELGLWAEEEGRGDAFHMAAFYGYFRDGLNLASTEVLLRLAAEAGLSEQQAEEVIMNRTHRNAVDHDWELSRQQGITAVPTFLLGQHRLVGAQSYETLAQILDQLGMKKKNNEKQFDANGER